MPVYLTEYGYFASGKRALSPKTTSRYLQQAYSIALKNGRVKSPAAVPAADAAEWLGLDLQHRDREAERQAPAAVQRAEALVQRSSRGKVKRPGGAINLPAAPANPTR